MIADSSRIMNIKQMGEEFRNLRIPDLQRDYVWDEIQWEKLWDDLMDVYRSCYERVKDADAVNQHFMGIIVLKKADDNTYDVIDGQQRLTTLTVVSDVISDVASGSGPSEKKNGSVEKAHCGIGVEIAGLKLDNSKDVREMDSWEEKDPYVRAYNFFAGLYASVHQKVNPVKLLDVFKRRLFFAVTYEENGVNENDLFEQINAYGKPLVFADLLLNYLIELGGTSGSGKKLTSAEIRGRWNKMLDQIYNEELPPEEPDEDYDEEDDEGGEEGSEEESFREMQDDLETDPSEEKGQKDRFNEPGVYRPLKLKKFLNMLNGLTIPSVKGMRESVDDFERAMERIKRSFPNSDPRPAKDAGYILDELEKWLSCYILYLQPNRASNQGFARHLYYLKCIGSTKNLPAIIRSLYRRRYCESAERFRDKDCEDLFRSMVAAYLLKKIYVERDNNKELNKKLKFADHIYASLPERKRHKAKQRRGSEGRPEIFSCLLRIG